MQTRLTLGLGDTERVELGKAIKAARIALRLSQRQLGDHFHVSKSAVAQWESGKNMPDPRKLPEIVRFLDLDPAVAVGADMHNRDVVSSSLSPRLQGNLADALRAPFRRDEMPKDVPVYGTAAGGNFGDADFSLNLGEPIDFARRPPRIAGRRDIFCLFMVGDSMHPWRESGGLIYVEANKQPRINDYVVVELHPEDGDDIRQAYCKRLVGLSNSFLTLEQYNPSKTFRLDRRKVGRLLRVMDWDELLAS